ncbi:MAG: hypothetical protein PHW18_00790 [Sulfuricurvum sp.]|uniref:hypothetical protein n=1 Tax=Sulfuricurvum sp. TaxID=2025608 RepID=UPI002608DEB6|nr:hypothetical protein [Sulfuricurvum sp.]MDD2828089.1 hypothetical protein [Sulfuricurvum sp.]MDD4948037.1 hypothetical protein [Sulfuricurvum sp.]
MRKSVLMMVVCNFLGWSVLHADVSEMVLYPNSTFSSAVAHFYHQGDKAEKYGFLFDEKFSPKQILYAQPDNYILETLKDKKVKLSFDKTDRYSYMKQIKKEDFIVENNGHSVKLLMSGGDCAGECLTGRNILTVVIPDGYSVIGYKGLDNNLKELTNKEWKITDNTYTLFAPKVKGACIYLELAKGSAPSSKAKELTPKSITPSTLVYSNLELFEIGDINVSIQGKQLLKTLVSRVGSSSKLMVTILQDHVPPKRLATLYPSAEKFSQARAEVMVKELSALGLSSEQIHCEVVDKPSEKARVEISITPVQ